MRIRTTLTLTAAALAVAALPAVAGPHGDACEDEVAHVLHDEVEPNAGPAAPAVHVAEDAYCDAVRG